MSIRLPAPPGRRVTVLENDRRRSMAHEMWLQQLTPEQRGQYELDHAGEAMEASPEVLEAAAMLVEIDEATEALQRAIERRD